MEQYEAELKRVELTSPARDVIGTAAPVERTDDEAPSVEEWTEQDRYAFVLRDEHIEARADARGLFDVAAGRYWAILKLSGRQVVSVEVRNRVPVFEDITPSETLRRLPLKRMAREMREAVVLFAKQDIEGADSDDLRRLLEAEKVKRLLALDAMPTKPGKRGPRGYEPEFYEAVAEVYRLAVEEGKPGTPAVRKHWGKSRATAARWVRTAREMDLDLGDQGGTS